MVKFFCTAIVLQRQTGGDLAEILDKIGHLIRERFQIWGQVQALTGEGRRRRHRASWSPLPVLFAVVYHMNPDYLMLLLTDDLGKKMPSRRRFPCACRDSDRAGKIVTIRCKRHRRCRTDGSAEFSHQPSRIAQSSPKLQHRFEVGHWTRRRGSAVGRKSPFLRGNVSAPDCPPK